MSVIWPPVRPNRVEPVLLERLRDRFPDVRFGTVRNRGNPPRECVLVAVPGRKATPVSQQTRLRVSVWVRRDDGTGDIDAAQNLAADIELYLTDHESGPIRMSDENGCLMAYLTLLLTVETNQA